MGRTPFGGPAFGSGARQTIFGGLTLGVDGPLCHDGEADRNCLGYYRGMKVVGFNMVDDMSAAGTAWGGRITPETLQMVVQKGRVAMGCLYMKKTDLEAYRRQMWDTSGGKSRSRSSRNLENRAPGPVARTSLPRAVRRMQYE